jgi:hypothetical protein
MAWPATLTGSPTTGITGASGNTYIRWGSDGLLQNPKPAGGYYVVLRFNEAPLVEPIKLPNGVGITTTRMFLVDGVQFSITVRDDSRMTPPVVGSTISIVDAAGLLGAVGLRYNAVVMNPSYDTAPKQAGERVIMAENLVAIDSQASSAQV